MSVKVEKTENKNEVKLEFTIDAKVFVEGMNTVYKNNMKYFSIPGFRKGKVPMNMVEKFYGEKIFYEDAFNEVVPEIYDNAIKDEKLDVVSEPEINIIQMEKGKDLIFTATVQLKPDVKLGNYKGISLEKKVYKVTDHNVEHELSHMADRNSRMVSVTDRPAKLDDVVTIDFDGSVDNIPFEGGKAENYELKLGSNTFIPGFEDQVVGMNVDEEKDVKVKFPDEYFSKDLAGKDAVFKVKVHEIKEKELPTIDDEFAKDVSEFDTLDELKADIKSKQEKQNEDRSKAELQDSAVKMISDNSEVEIPSGMIETELNVMEQDMDRRLAYQGLSLEQYLKMIGKSKEDFRTDNKGAAEEAVKVRLVIESIGKDAKIDVKDSDVEDRIKELAKTYGRKEEDLLKNEELKNNVKDSLVSEKTVEFIIENAKVKEVEVEDECECEHDHSETKKKASTKKSTTKKESSKKDETETDKK